MSFEPLKTESVTLSTDIKVRMLATFAELDAEATRCPLEADRKKGYYRSKPCEEMPILSVQTVDPFGPSLELKMVPVSTSEPD